MRRVEGDSCWVNRKKGNWPWRAWMADVDGGWAASRSASSFKLSLGQLPWPGVERSPGGGPSPTRRADGMGRERPGCGLCAARFRVMAAASCLTLQLGELRPRRLIGGRS